MKKSAAWASRLAAPALMLRARYTQRGSLPLVDASIIEAVPIGFTGQYLLGRKVVRDRGIRRSRYEALDLRAVLAAEDRARRIDEPAAGRDERPQPVQQARLKLGRPLDVF